MQRPNRVPIREYPQVTSFSYCRLITAPASPIYRGSASPFPIRSIRDSTPPASSPSRGTTASMLSTTSDFRPSSALLAQPPSVSRRPSTPTTWSSAVTTSPTAESPYRPRCSRSTLCGCLRRSRIQANFHDSSTYRTPLPGRSPARSIRTSMSPSRPSSPLQDR